MGTLDLYVLTKQGHELKSEGYTMTHSYITTYLISYMPMKQIQLNNLHWNKAGA